MVNYKCLRCGFKSNIKSRLINHLNRKFKCQPILSELNTRDVYNTYFENTSTNVKNSNPNVNKMSTKNRISNIHECKYCELTFNSRQGKWRHEKNNCEKNKIQILSNLLIKGEKEKEIEINKILENQNTLLGEQQHLYEEKIRAYLEIFKDELAKKDKTIYTLIGMVEEQKKKSQVINNHKNLNLTINIGHSYNDIPTFNDDSIDTQKQLCDKLKHLTLSPITSNDKM